MGTFFVVGDEIIVEAFLHFVNRLEPGPAALDAEVLVEQRSVEALDDAVRLRPLDPGGAVLNGLQLQEQFVGMLVGAAAEFPAIVRQDNVDLGPFGLEAGQHVVVHQVHGRHRQLAG